MNEEIPLIIRKIDIVLELFAKNSLAKDGLEFHEAFKMANLLFEHETPKIEPIETNEFWKITEKLKKDRFIVNEMGTNYEATYEGILMDHLKGYRQKYLDSNLAARLQNQAYRIQKTQTAIQIGIAVLTFVLAVGTLIAAWYYGIEIWKFYHPN